MIQNDVTTVELLTKPDTATLDFYKLIRIRINRYIRLIFDFSEEQDKFFINVRYNPDCILSPGSGAPTIEEVYNICLHNKLHIEYPEKLPVPYVVNDRIYYYIQTPFELEMAYIQSFGKVRQNQIHKLPIFLEYTGYENDIDDPRFRDITKSEMRDILQSARADIDALSSHL